MPADDSNQTQSQARSSQEPPKDDIKQVADKLNSSSNVLITVSKDPSIDQLAACIGLTLYLNKHEDKHGTAVYSGSTPSTIEFLEPEKTLESNTDSLRDFIISLDKDKADKLRYKVDDDVVKIFITPYRTSISEKDLNFSEGEYNVDVVLALGVHNQSDLDNAITSHGNIMHDATVISVNTKDSGKTSLGAINLIKPASSLSEIAADLALDLDEGLIDNQIANSFLTGIISETDRFSNDKSGPHTMAITSKLMEFGASTQLVTSKLKLHQGSASGKKSTDNDGNSEGLLKIKRDKKENKTPPKKETTRTKQAPKPASKQPKQEKQEEKDPAAESPPEPPKFVSQPPKTGGRLTASDRPEYQQMTGSTDPLSVDINETGGSAAPRPAAGQSAGQTKESGDIQDNETLENIEKEVRGQQDVPPPPAPEEARKEVEEALGGDQNNQTDENPPEESDDEEKPGGPPPVPPPLMPNP